MSVSRFAAICATSFVALDPFGDDPPCDSDEHGQRRLEVGQRADLERVVPAQLGGIDVDLHELRGGDVEGVLGVPRARVGLGEPRAEREDPVGGPGRLVDEGRAPEPGHPQHQRAVVGQRALAHEAVRHGQRQKLGELLELGCRIRCDDPAADIEHRPVCREQVADDPLRDLFIEAGLGERAGVAEHLVEQGDVDLGREHVHRHVDEHGSGSAALGEGERLVEHLGDEVRLVDAPRALDEGSIDLPLGGIGVEVDLLVRMLAEVVARHVAGDHDQRNRIERGVRHGGGGIRQTGAEVGQDDPGPLGHPGVAVGRVRRDLLVPHVDEGDALALLERREQSDVRVPAQPEDVLDIACLQIADDLVRHQVLHDVLLHLSPSTGTDRRAGPV